MIQFLQDTGSQLKACRIWRHAQLDLHWKLGDLGIQISNTKLHTCFARDGARNSGRFLARRDSTPFRNINYGSDLVAVARKVAKDQSGPALALLLGSFGTQQRLSSAAMSQRSSNIFCF